MNNYKLHKNLRVITYYTKKTSVYLITYYKKPCWENGSHTFSEVQVESNLTEPPFDLISKQQNNHEITINY